MNTGKRALVAAILLIHVAITAWLSAVLGMRVDEAYTFHTTSATQAYAIHQALHFELQPPLYFLTLEMWRHLNQSLFFARLLSVITVAIAVYVVGRVGQCYVAPNLRIPSMIVAAFNPFVVASAVDARVYAFVLLWCALLMWLFYLGFLSEPKSLIKRVAFGAAATAGLYTQYYIGFLLLGFCVVVVLQKRWRDLAAYLLLMVLVLVSFEPIIGFIRAEMATNALNYYNDKGFLANARDLIATLVHMVIPVDWSSHSNVFYVVALLVLIVLIRSKGRIVFANSAVVMVTIAVAGVSFVLAVTAAHAPVTQHYVSALFVPALILTVALVYSAVDGRGGIAFVGVTVLLFCTNIGSLAVDYRALAKSGDTSRVAAFIKARESVDQPIVVFDAQSALPLSYEYHGINKIVPMPRPMRFDRYDLNDIAIHNDKDVRLGLGYRAGLHHELWLVNPPGDECRRVPVNLHCEILYGFLKQHYKTLLDKKFYGARVRLLQQTS